MCLGFQNAYRNVSVSGMRLDVCIQDDNVKAAAFRSSKSFLENAGRMADYKFARTHPGSTDRCTGVRTILLSNGQINLIRSPCGWLGVQPTPPASAPPTMCLHHDEANTAHCSLHFAHAHRSKR